MDVFYPLNPQVSSTNKTPVLFFFYGGRYIRGDRTLANQPLMYGNVGSYFALQGFLTVIADYRLVPHVTYPGPSEDVCDALGWLASNTDTVQADSGLSIDLEHIFLLGHSAGTTHISVAFLDPNVKQYLDQRFPYKIKGFVAVSGAFHMSKPGVDLEQEIINAYWGSTEEAMKKLPLSLLEAGSPEILAAFPETKLIEAENDFPVIKMANDHFQLALEKRLQKTISRSVGKGHNHLSLVAALGSGEGEEWAEEAVIWIKERL
jgi:acetyl esterase/lipase